MEVKQPVLWDPNGLPNALKMLRVNCWGSFFN